MDKQNQSKGMEEGFAEDLYYFVNMCGKEDRKIFQYPNRKKPAEQYARLICAAMALGLRGAMLRLFNLWGEERLDELFRCLDGWTFEEVKKHIEAFIAGVEHPLFKQAAEETWLERQKTLSAENFKIRNLL